MSNLTTVQEFTINTDFIARLNVTASTKFFICWLLDHQDGVFTKARIATIIGVDKKTLNKSIEEVEAIGLLSLLKGIKNGGKNHLHDHDINKLNNINKSNHDHEGEKIIKKSDLESQDKILDLLGVWQVFKPESLIEQFGIDRIRECIILTLEYKARIPGAYFRKLLNSKSKADVMHQSMSVETSKSIIDRIESEKQFSKSPYDDVECAREWLASLTEEELKHDFIQKRVDKIKEIWDL